MTNFENNLYQKQPWKVHMIYSLLIPTSIAIMYFVFFNQFDNANVKILMILFVAIGYPLAVLHGRYNCVIGVDTDSNCKCSHKWIGHNKKGCSICQCSERVYALDMNKWVMKSNEQPNRKEDAQ